MEENKVVTIIKKINPDISIDETKILDIYYLDEGLLDSFQLVQFIDDLEKEFTILLTPADLESEEFRTLRGVISILKEKLDHV